MRTLTYQLRDLKKAMICIGFEDENNRTQVRIDCGEVFAEYPNATVTMKVQAPKGGIYPATVTREENVILWTVRDCDVANKGSGEFQLTFTDGTTVIKTCVGRFHVDRSLKGSGTAPSGVQDWLENAEKVLEQVESAEIHQPMIGLDGYWYKWNQEAGEYVSTGTKAQGQDGQPGTDATPDLIAKDYADLSFPVAKDSFCYHDGKLYQAKQAIQTSEEWTAAHWQETTVEEQITAQKSDIQLKTGELSEETIVLSDAIGYSNNISVKISSLANDGHFWNSQGDTAILADHAEYRTYNAIPIAYGEHYHIKIYQKGSAKQHPVLLTDDNLKIIERFKTVTTQNEIWTEFEFTIPLGATKMLLTTGLGFSATITKGLLTKYGKHWRDVTTQRMYGKFWNSQGDTAILNSYGYYQAYYPVPVKEGDICIISGWYGSSAKQHLAVIVDKDYGILSRLGTMHSSEEKYQIVIPENAAYVLMTTDNTDKYVSCQKLVENEIEETVGGLFDFRGANVAIIGDSISTNGEYSAQNPLGNVPEIIIQSEDVGVSLSAYVTYYDIGTTVGGHEIVAADVGTELTFTPVAGDVGKVVGKPLTYNAAAVKTWWEVAQDVLGFNPIPVCWSGSSVTSHEGTTDAYKTSYAWHPAQIRKCGIRIPGEMTRLAPDMIIIYRGTNDFSHTSYAKLTDGYFDSDSWEAPETDVITGGYGFKEGLALTVKKLREAYPKTKIVLCTLNFFKRVNYSSYPVNNGQNTENQFNNAIREVADYLGCGLIEFDKDGLTYENATDQYYSDNTEFTHPKNTGHKIMGNKAIRDLMKENAFLW